MERARAVSNKTLGQFGDMCFQVNHMCDGPIVQGLGPGHGRVKPLCAIKMHMDYLVSKTIAWIAAYDGPIRGRKM